MKLSLTCAPGDQHISAVLQLCSRHNSAATANPTPHPKPRHHHRHTDNTPRPTRFNLFCEILFKFFMSREEMKAKSQKVKKMKVHHVSKVLCMCREHTMLGKCAKEKKKKKALPWAHKHHCKSLVRTDGASLAAERKPETTLCAEACTESGGPRWALLASQAGVLVRGSHLSGRPRRQGGVRHHRTPTPLSVLTAHRGLSPEAEGAHQSREKTHQLCSDCRLG